MRVITACFVAALVAACASEAVAQTTARGMYNALQSRERVARRALDAGRPARTVRRDVTRLVVGYQGLVARFPRSGYSDNALWQAAFLAADAFARYRVDEDRETAVRLLRRLGREYPTSGLIKRSEPALKRLLAAAPSATAPAVAAAAAPSTGPADGPGPADVERVAGTVAGESKAGLATIRAIRRTVLPDVVRIAIELDQETQYQYDRIENPVRVFLDLNGTVAGSGVKAATPFDDPVVKGVRLGPRPSNGTRVVLDLDRAGRHSVFTLFNPFRIVVDIDRRAGAPGVVAAVNTAAGPPPLLEAAAAPSPDAPVERVRVPEEEEVKPTPPIPLPARKAVPSGAATTAPEAPVPPSANVAGRFSLSRQLGLGIARIVIDPGHGGHDPGTKGRGLTEADLVLDIARRLETLLLKEPGVEVVLTRKSDVFVPLEERTAIANREGADLFLSIHANSSRNRKAGGVETYFLNFASNPDAEAVAARENSASGRTMHSLPDIVRAITLNNKLDESRDFAMLVQRAMVENLGRANRSLRDRGVKQAPFVVLIGAGMPSILAEIAFMTHSQESKLLKTGAYRQRVAEALFQGVRRYQRSLKAVTAVASQE